MVLQGVVLATEHMDVTCFSSTIPAKGLILPRGENLLSHLGVSVKWSCQKSQRDNTLLHYF